MAREIALPTHRDERGSLTVIEGLLSFTIARVYFMYDCGGSKRGGHRHKKTRQALVCVRGRCTVDWENEFESGSAMLINPQTLLVLEPEDWHVMHDFSSDAVLLVLASEIYDPNDYVNEGYRR
jgi:dTDP-4-dehydrorhamnose 3,5-epimerase-like enzyme